MITKPELRKTFLSRRNNLNKAEITQASEKILTQFISNYSLSNKKVHCFKSIPDSKEINTEYFFSFCHFHSISIATSITKTNPNRLDHSWVDKNSIFYLDSFRVPTPEKIINVDISKLDIVIIPLLCCDIKGNRIGYGQGFYDSFLAKLPSTTLKIGISFFEPIDAIIEADNWDIKLNELVTPNSIIEF